LGTGDPDNSGVEKLMKTVVSSGERRCKENGKLEGRCSQLQSFAKFTTSGKPEKNLIQT
jgi:hypothetical protein